MHSFSKKPQTYLSQRRHQKSQRLLEDILVSWDGYHLICRWNALKDLKRVMGGDTLMILLPFEDKQAELKTYFHHRPLDTSQLPLLRKQPRITINRECLMDFSMERGVLSNSKDNNKKKEMLLVDSTAKVKNINVCWGQPQKSILKSIDGDGSVNLLMASPLKRSVTFESLADGNESHIVASVDVSIINETTDATGSPNTMIGTFVSLLKPERTTMKINFCSLRNEEQVVNSNVVIPKHAKDKVMCRYENTLVEYFMGKSITFPLVQNYVNNTWSKFGLQKVMRTDNEVFLFKFLSSTGVDQVLERGPWLIRKSPIILTKWSPLFALKKGDGYKAPPKDTNRDPTSVEENEDDFIQVKSRKKKKKKMDKSLDESQNLDDSVMRNWKLFENRSAN
ncbi:integrase, catalytic region, zinc finger, CCHC-type containing protein [Tanacetum coccineum]